MKNINFRTLLSAFAISMLVGVSACDDAAEDVGDRVEDVGDKTEDVVDDAVN